MNWILIDKIIENALIEDIGHGDITTETLIGKGIHCRGKFIAKEEGIIAGLEVVERVFKKIDKDIEFVYKVTEGQYVHKGDAIAGISGLSGSILTGERVALNFLQKLSGIATKTHRCVQLVNRFNVKVVDTRKTTPGLRTLEKYAVTIGGGFNHRYNLSDCILIKDNHIKVMGGIKNAVKKAIERVGHTMKIEVEVETLEQLYEALEAKADIILLDNMDVNTMREAVEIVNGRAITEASGMIDEQNIVEAAAAGVDIISMGSLTHSVKAMDISLKII